MTSASISGIHGRSNQYYLSSILGAFRLYPLPIPSFRMNLFVSKFLFFFRKLIQSFPWTYGAYGKCIPKGCWHTTGVTLGELFPCIEAETLLLFSRVGEEWTV
jgi:hypothetical protein